MAGNRMRTVVLALMTLVPLASAAPLHPGVTLTFAHPTARITAHGESSCDFDVEIIGERLTTPLVYDVLARCPWDSDALCLEM